MRAASLCGFKYAPAQRAHVPRLPSLAEEQALVSPKCVTRLVVKRRPQISGKNLRGGAAESLLRLPQAPEFVANHLSVGAVFVTARFVANSIAILTTSSPPARLPHVWCRDRRYAFLTHRVNKLAKRASLSFEHLEADFSYRLLDFAILAFAILLRVANGKSEGAATLC
jgi:hypothetical protein